ncbi:MAG: ABC transporter substrate-binding protein [Trichlorobacter sp.]|uniref:ABC transporter substrate-binding protein n=1 Tax=Trichlorobacter sp. TaxID=2911007 RepID=UPI00256D214D|nr:ABC transporter substrate-binding protein [Trichlorobacter sp.]MDK9716897.1 ABC transporter substrate-binding protein [Trichlorobacter sp.]
MKKLVMVCSMAALLLCSATMSLAAGTIKIGGLFSVTGPASFLGEPEKKTLEMLVADLNAKGGINGQKLEAVIYDTAGDATKAVQLATKLIKNDKVVAIIGPSTTGESMAVLALTEKEKIPLISCAAGIKITEPAKDRKFTFKTPANDHVAVEKILQYAARVKQKNLAILTVTDGFGASGREQLKVSAAQKGFTIVADETYGPKDTDMTPQLTKIRSSKADAIICWGTNPGPAIITKNIKQLGIKIPVYMSHGVASKKYIELASPAAAEGIMLPAGKLAVYDALPKNDPQQKLLREYDAAYKKAHGVEASTFGGYAYDAFLLVTNAIKTKGATPAQIRDGLEQTKKLVSVSGVFTMSATDHNGLDLSAFEMVKIHKGDWAILK